MNGDIVDDILVCVLLGISLFIILVFLISGA